ncbi:MAG TPA: hypothetical protein DCE78_13210 [Bacteroidetes bacterium]|nr:hypothetical protein [Bacteroidota bacterium]
MKMDINEFYNLVNSAASVLDIEHALEIFEKAHPHKIKWIPVGERENNVGTIGAAADPGRSIVERVTNGIDAVLELEYEQHHHLPDCRSPREAAVAWLNIPPQGLSELSQASRQKIADKIIVTIQEGDSRSSRIVTIRDEGIGLTPEQMPKTILSLNQSNKLQKYYLAGMYGQGGSSTFARCKYTIITSRSEANPRMGFTIVRYLDLPAEIYKSGHYVYLTFDDSVLQLERPIEEFPKGTEVKHYGYDLSNYSSMVGPNSVYGLLNSVLFDPVLPIWLDNRVHKSRHVIKGSRNALNGAVDEGDENRKGPELSHAVKMFYPNLGDWGRIGIEYWVLQKPDKKNPTPIRAFVNSQKPVILTLNGQSHAEFSKILVSKKAELPYLTPRLIGHIDCNNLSPLAKRELFVSNRENARICVVSDLIQQEFVKALKSDDELIRLNNEARSENLNEKDENALQQMRKEVANILHVQGIDSTLAIGGVKSGGKDKNESPIYQIPHKRTLKPIEIHDPPTYIKIMWKVGEDIPLYPGQRIYIRIETDANSTYHDANDPQKSKLNIINSPGVITACGSTSLNNGRMRIIYESNPKAEIGTKSQIRVELTRPGLSMLVAEHPIIIVPKPPVTNTKNQISLPPFDIIAIDPDNPMWNVLNWPEDSDKIASEAILNDGILNIYYSTAFQKYAEKRNKFESRDPALAASFTNRYEIWLIIHSLLLDRDKQTQDQIVSFDDNTTVENSEILDDYERRERCRLATISTIIAEREVLSSIPPTSDE